MDRSSRLGFVFAERRVDWLRPTDAVDRPISCNGDAEPILEYSAGGIRLAELLVGAWSADRRALLDGWRKTVLAKSRQPVAFPD
jgi:hypothetical protein